MFLRTCRPSVPHRVTGSRGSGRRDRWAGMLAAAVLAGLFAPEIRAAAAGRAFGGAAPGTGRGGAAGSGATPAVPTRSAAADEIAEKFRVGAYGDAVVQAERALSSAPTDQDVHILLIQTLLTLGRNADAYQAAQRAVDRVSNSIRVRWAAREAALASGDLPGAELMVSSIRTLYNASMTSFSDPASRVVTARVGLLLGADPRQVLDNWLTPAQRADPRLRDIYLLKGELALTKHDYNVASRAYQDGLRQIPGDPDLHAGLARSYEAGQRQAMIGELEKALQVNTRHVPSLLQLVEHEIAGEDYAGAERLLDQVRAVNPVHPDEWAFRAVIAHLRNQPEEEQKARDTALGSWKNNPRVDYLIGKKLAEKYRFTEAAAAQRRALAFDPDFLPAKAELAVDLLRLGEETEGWKLAAEVAAADPYDVEAFNLMTLHDTLDKYTVLRSDRFQIRMPAHDAEIYGQRALALLEKAYTQMTAKYGLVPEQPTIVEIFGDQKDFAVRTFGMPDVAGFLGVCFGRVLTANGPAAAVGTNWEEVLWHEFCHVITLQLTKNRMPRWLSEGISVHEEALADASWGMPLTPEYWQRITEGRMSPVAEMSAAFLNPKDGEDLQFAYFQSGLVVGFFFEKYGAEKVRAVLRDLGTGVEINRALAAHLAPIETLEADFKTYAVAQANAIAPGLKFTPPPSLRAAPGGRGGGSAAGDDMASLLDNEGLAAWAMENADNYWALLYRARAAIRLKNWEGAKPLVERLIAAYPIQKGGNSAYQMLALIQQELGDVAGERATLKKVAELESETTDIYLRLMELSLEVQDWETMARAGDRYLAVNPLVVAPYRYLARASLERNELPLAIGSLRTMLKLDPPNPADIHFELARTLQKAGEPGARRQALLALEEAPRFRAALSFLESLPPEPAGAPAAAPVPAPEGRAGGGGGGGRGF